MIFAWIEQEISEGEPWEIFPSAIPYPEDDIFDHREIETYLDYHSDYESMHSNLHLRRESHHLLELNPDSALM